MSSMAPIGPLILWLSAVLSSLMVVRARSASHVSAPLLQELRGGGSTSSASASSTAADDLTAYAPIEPSLNSVSSKVHPGEPIVVAIAGGSGSGKTTLARAIHKEMGDANVVYINHDSYYRDISHLSMEERAECNFDHPDSLETSLLVEHIKDLKANKAVRIPKYDYSTHSRVYADSHEAQPRPIILVEGILILSDPALYNLFDVKIFVDTDDDIRLIRRMNRDVAERGRSVQSVVQQYLKTVQPMHQQFVVPSKRNADIIVPEGLNSVALDLVVSKLTHWLSRWPKNG
jgi:uridine kinase